jgi:hypothetical protein
VYTVAQLTRYTQEVRAAAVAAAGFAAEQAAAAATAAFAAVAAAEQTGREAVAHAQALAEEKAVGAAVSPPGPLSLSERDTIARPELGCPARIHSL